MVAGRHRKITASSTHSLLTQHFAPANLVAVVVIIEMSKTEFDEKHVVALRTKMHQSKTPLMNSLTSLSHLM